MEEFEFKVKLIKTKRKKSATIVIKNDIVSISAPKTLKDDQIYEIHAIIEDKSGN